MNGVVTAVSQTKREAQALMRIALDMHDDVRTTKKHKKHQFEKECEFCGRMCKGAIGLAVHKKRCKDRNVSPLYDAII